jgi:hypothetical protein
MSEDIIDDSKQSDETPVKSISRRELLNKYGAYTAPVVVAMLTPELAYAHMVTAVYSSTAECVGDSANMHRPNMVNHCTGFHGST